MREILLVAAPSAQTQLHLHRRPLVLLAESSLYSSPSSLAAVPFFAFGGVLVFSQTAVEVWKNSLMLTVVQVRKNWLMMTLVELREY